MIPNINLLPKLEKERSGPIWLYIVSIVVVAIILALFIMQYFGAKSDLTSLIAQQQELTTERDDLQMQLSVLQGMNQGSLEQSVQYVENVSYPVTPLVNETNNLLPDFSYLRSYVFSEESVVITVDFETMTAISDYLESLLASPFFTDTQLASVSNFEVDPNAKTEEDNDAKYSQIPRYTTSITLSINKSYLATAGGDE